MSQENVGRSTGRTTEFSMRVTSFHRFFCDHRHHHHHPRHRAVVASRVQTNPATRPFRGVEGQSALLRRRCGPPACRLGISVYRDLDALSQREVGDHAAKNRGIVRSPRQNVLLDGSFMQSSRCTGSPSATKDGRQKTDLHTLNQTPFLYLLPEHFSHLPLKLASF